MTWNIRRMLAVAVVALVAVSSFSISNFSDQNGMPSASLICVACIGDSITEGSGYPENLQEMLGSNYRVGNFGVSGSTVLSKSNIPYASQPEFVKAKAFQPSIIIIMLGTNDAHEETYQSIEDFSVNYKKLISEYQELNSNPEIWLVKPPPIFRNNLNLHNTNLEQGIIPRIEQVADELNLPLIDINMLLSEYPEHFGDGVHPNNNGAMLIASEIFDVIISESY